MKPETLKMLKKIQPLFTEWKVGDRGWDGSFNEELFFDGYGAKTIRFVNNFSSLRVLPLDTKSVLHYPYPHQVWNSLDREKSYIGSASSTVEVYVKGKFLCSEVDLETALLKALVWQMEEK